MTEQPQPDKKPEQTPAAETPSAKPEAADKAPAPAQPATESAPATQPAASSASPAAPAVPAKSEPAPSAPAAAPTEPAKPIPSEPAKTRDIREIARQLGHDVTYPSPASNPPPAVPSVEDTFVAPENAKSTQRIPEPSSAPPSSVQICPTCGHRNRPGTLICDNCGTNLMTGNRSTVGTRDLMREAEKEADKPAQQAIDTGELRAVETAGASTFTEEMVLRVEIEGGTTPMLVYPKQEIIMGRRDPNTGGMPDVDLTAYAGYRMGVSRRHAAIRLQDKQLQVSDLGSSNGTFLNGTRLNAHRPYPLRDGDEVRLGQMVLRLYFQSNKDRKS
ncbi:MAG: FHA domain-containing protein [Anaerolineae bacterium]|nr:FHA domain-containing protein [Anaerolineae bacterium]